MVRYCSAPPPGVKSYTCDEDTAPVPHQYTTTVAVVIHCTLENIYVVTYASTATLSLEI